MKYRALFDSFNARYLDPEQVGSSFIYNPLFERLLERNHSVLIGPRGSGKTTLLKMLRLPALAKWSHKSRARLLSKLSFVAFYVPADALWSPQYRSPISAKLPVQVNDLFSANLFRLSLLGGLCDLLSDMRSLADSPSRHLFQFSAFLTEIELSNFCRALSINWGLTRSHGSVEGIRQEIKKRITAIQFLIVRSSVGQQITADQLLESDPELARNVVDDISSFADLLDKKIESGCRICACIDELEIAPPALRHSVIQYTRSTDQRILFKISASPFDESLEFSPSASAPMPGHDYSEVLLTVLQPTAARKFGERMFEALAREFGLDKHSPEEILQDTLYNSGIQSARKARNERYKIGGKNKAIIDDLKTKDSSFKTFLENKDIGENIDRLTEDQRAAKVRKWIAVAAVRNEFLRTHDPSESRTRRSRKQISSFYTGHDAIIDMCEGNPRWLIGTIRPLMAQYKELHEGIKTPLPLSNEVQASQIRSAITVYLSLLSNIRIDDLGPTKYGSPIDLLYQLGDFFSDQVLSPKFDPEPVMSFRADSNVPSTLLTIIGRLTNQGAFVLLPDKDKQVELGKIRGYRFRITNMLAPLFKLPMIRGRERNLSAVLTSADAPDTRDLLTDLMRASNVDR